MKHKTSKDLYAEQYRGKGEAVGGERTLAAQVDETNRLLAEIGTVLEDLVLTLQVNRIVDGEGQ